jgi:hypothetical protein
VCVRIWRDGRNGGGGEGGALCEKWNRSVLCDSGFPRVCGGGGGQGGGGGGERTTGRDGDRE